MSQKAIILNGSDAQNKSVLSFCKFRKIPFTGLDEANSDFKGDPCNHPKLKESIHEDMGSHPYSAACPDCRTVIAIRWIPKLK